MEVSWLFNNSRESNGFIAKRVRIVTYMAITYVYGFAFLRDHGQTMDGVSIAQILEPKLLKKENDHA